MSLTGPEIVKLLKENLSPESQYSLPNDPDKKAGNRRWTRYKAPTFCASAKPASVADIQSAVQCATDNGVPFLATATGHHYTAAFETCRDVLEIDISAFKDISINKAANTMTIGGAVTHAEVMDPLYEVGKEMGVGACSSTGIVGVTLGGGLQRWQGLYGMLIDNLLSVEMVTAHGELVKASKTENTELFWGIRGAGFNFGIVVSATYRIYDFRSGGVVLVADLILPWKTGPECMRILKKWETNQPPALSVVAGPIYNEEAGGPVVIISALYMDDVEEGKRLIQPFLDLEPMVQAVRPVPLNKVNKEWCFGIDATLNIYEEPRIFYSAHLKVFDIPTFEWYFESVKKIWEKYPAARGTTLMVEDWATKASEEVPDDETAYPHRDVMCQMVILQHTTDPSLEPMLDDFGRETRARFDATSGFDSPRMYCSYAYGDESQESVYGKRKLERLRALKRTWDPKGAFNWNTPIVIES